MCKVLAVVPSVFRDVAYLLSGEDQRHGPWDEAGLTVRPVPVWVNRVILTACCSLPVYPDKQTFSLFVGIFKSASRRPSCSVQNERGRSGVN
jgi:hypothetical protein